MGDISQPSWVPRAVSGPENLWPGESSADEVFTLGQSLWSCLLSGLLQLLGTSEVIGSPELPHKEELLSRS